MRPVNMQRMTRILLKLVRLLITPVDRPTVPRADTESKKVFIREVSGCRIWIRKVTVKTRISARNTMENAFRTIRLGILLLNIMVSSLPRITQIMAISMMPRVFIFTPPAVDPDAPPMNIIKEINTLETPCRESISKIEKPEDLALTDKNRDSLIFCPRGRPAIAWFFSRRNMNNAVESRRTAERMSTIFV